MSAKGGLVRVSELCLMNNKMLVIVNMYNIVHVSTCALCMFNPHRILKKNLR